MHYFKNETRFLLSLKIIKTLWMEWEHSILEFHPTLWSFFAKRNHKDRERWKPNEIESRVSPLCKKACIYKMFEKEHVHSFLIYALVLTHSPTFQSPKSPTKKGEKNLPNLQRIFFSGNIPSTNPGKGVRLVFRTSYPIPLHLRSNQAWIHMQITNWPFFAKKDTVLASLIFHIFLRRESQKE